jgi:dsDNA-specific endonuclease/ATPase MutS2
MPDETNPNAETEQKSNDATPPWGSDEDFDAGKAWTLIQNLRADKASLTTKVSEFERAAQEAEDAKKDDLTKATDALTRAQEEAAKARRDLALERIIRRYPALEEIEDVAEFLTGNTEEEIEAKAKRLAAHAPKGREEEQHEQDNPLAQRPRPDLTPGHSPANQSTAFDASAVAKEIRARRF